MLVEFKEERDFSIWGRYRVIVGSGLGGGFVIEVGVEDISGGEMRVCYVGGIVRIRFRGRDSWE